MSLLTEGKELTQYNTITSQSQLKTDINMESSGVEETKDKDLKSAVRQKNQIELSKEHVTVAAALFSITILSVGGFIGFRKYEKNKSFKTNQQSNQFNNFSIKTEPQVAYKYSHNKSAGQIIDENSASEDSNNPKDNIDIQENPNVIQEDAGFETIQSIPENLPEVTEDTKVIKKNTKWETITSIVSGTRKISGKAFSVSKKILSVLKSVNSEYNQHLNKIAENEKKELERLEKISLKNIANRMKADSNNTEESKLKQLRLFPKLSRNSQDKRSTEIEKLFSLNEADQLKREKKVEFRVFLQAKRDQLDHQISELEITLIKLHAEIKVSELEITLIKLRAEIKGVQTSIELLRT